MTVFVFMISARTIDVLNIKDTENFRFIEMQSESSDTAQEEEVVDEQETMK